MVNSHKPTYYYERGRKFASEGKYEKALYQYNRALELKPEEPDYHAGKSDALFKLRYYWGALKEINTAIKVYHFNAWYH